MLKIRLLFLLLIVFSMNAFAGSYNLINTGEDFRHYVTQAKKHSFDEQWSEWKKFEATYKTYFNAVTCDSTEARCEASKKEHLKDFFAKLPLFEDRMWEIFKNADHLSKEHMARFRKEFPDLQPDVKIIFLPSLLFFNGIGCGQIDDSCALFVGADLTALRENNLDVLFSHEFFHTYHFQKLKNKKTFQTMATPLWTEGFAVWISQHLNPKASDEDLLMNKELAEYCKSPAHVKEMAQIYKSFLTKQKDDAAMSKIKIDWFQKDGSTQPSRRGYCLGWHVMQKITQQHSIQELVGLDEDSYTALILKALNQLGK